jgi:uncharacterized protein
MFKEDEVMTFSSFRLMQYHQKIDRELRAEITRRWPDIFRVQKLKRLKLAIKDRLERQAKAPARRPLRLNKI